MVISASRAVAFVSPVEAESVSVVRDEIPPTSVAESSLSLPSSFIVEKVLQDPSVLRSSC